VFVRCVMGPSCASRQVRFDRVSAMSSRRINMCSNASASRGASIDWSSRDDASAAASSSARANVRVCVVFASSPMYSPRSRGASRGRRSRSTQGLPFEQRYVDLCGNQMLRRNHDLHAIDATPAQRRGGLNSSPLDGASTAASSSRNDLVKNCRCTRHTG